MPWWGKKEQEHPIQKLEPSQDARTVAGIAGLAVATALQDVDECTDPKEINRLRKQLIEAQMLEAQIRRDLGLD